MKKSKFYRKIAKARVITRLKTIPLTLETMRDLMKPWRCSLPEKMTTEKIKKNLIKLQILSKNC